MSEIVAPRWFFSTILTHTCRLLRTTHVTLLLQPRVSITVNTYWQWLNIANSSPTHHVNEDVSDTVVCFVSAARRKQTDPCAPNKRSDRTRKAYSWAMAQASPQAWEQAVVVNLSSVMFGEVPSIKMDIIIIVPAGLPHPSSNLWENWTGWQHEWQQLIFKLPCAVLYSHLYITVCVMGENTQKLRCEKLTSLDLKWTLATDRTNVKLRWVTLKKMFTVTAALKGSPNTYAYVLSSALMFLNLIWNLVRHENCLFLFSAFPLRPFVTPQPPPPPRAFMVSNFSMTYTDLEIYELLTTSGT